MIYVLHVSSRACCGLGSPVRFANLPATPLGSVARSVHRLQWVERAQTLRQPGLKWAWFNGLGYCSWENLWGQWNGISPRDGTVDSPSDTSRSHTPACQFDARLCRRADVKVRRVPALLTVVFFGAKYFFEAMSLGRSEKKTRPNRKPVGSGY